MLCIWDVYEHCLKKYKLRNDTKHKICGDHSYNGTTSYNFPTNYDISFNSKASFYKSSEYVLHFIFIALVFIDFIYSHIHLQLLLFSSSTLIFAIFSASFFFCTISSCFGLINQKSKSKRKTTLTLQLCQTSIFLLLLFTILLVFFAVSPPLLLYLCCLYLIKANPIKYMIEFLELHDILNMKNMQIDYNFIQYNPMMIDNYKNISIYQYLLVYILIKYECNLTLASNTCLQKCNQIISAAYYDSDMFVADHKLSNIKFSKRTATKNWFVIQKYVTNHMIVDIISMVVIFIFVLLTFWCCFFYFIHISHGHNNNVYNFYATTYMLYILLFLLLIMCFLLDIESTISHNLGWLKPLYFASDCGIQIKNIHYVKFMYCYCDILCVSATINAIDSSLNNEKLVNIIIGYLYDICFENWLELMTKHHYCYNYNEIKQQEINSLQFDISHWLTLKITICSVCDLKYFAFNGMDKIYAKIKMIKPKYINHQRKRLNNDIYDIYGSHNDGYKATNKVTGNVMNETFLFSLKYTEISCVKFVISVISECDDTEYDDVVGLSNIYLKDIFYNQHKKVMDAFFDLQCKNEESGGIKVQFEILQFDPIYHINQDMNENNNVDVVVDDDTVPLIAIN